MRQPWWRALTLACVLLVVSGCAQKPLVVVAPDGARTSWGGRLALRVDSDPVQSFSAAFELRGRAEAGELTLYTPLGSTVARLAWSAGEAFLQRNGATTQFASLAELTRQATGAELPIASLFRWLAGEASAADGWNADLEGLSSGRLLAQRVAPLPRVQLRLVLD